MPECNDFLAVAVSCSWRSFLRKQPPKRFAVDSQQHCCCSAADREQHLFGCEDHTNAFAFVEQEAAAAVAEAEPDSRNQFEVLGMEDQRLTFGTFVAVAVVSDVVLVAGATVASASPDANAADQRRNQRLQSWLWLLLLPAAHDADVNATCRQQLLLSAQFAIADCC